MKDIKGYECKHVVYAPSRFKNSDLLVIKEYIHKKDGSIIPNLRLIKDFQRDFYITHPLHKKHKTKKEFENINHCQKFTCAQYQLPNAIRNAVGYGSFDNNLRMLFNDPYLYGASVRTPVILKKMYLDKFPDLKTPNSVAVLDIETDEISEYKTHVKDNKVPIYICLSFRNKVFLGVLERFIQHIENPIEKLKSKAEELLGEIFKQRNIELTIEVFKTPGKMCKKTFDYAHQWKPDFISAWNISFDLPIIMNTLEKEGYDLAEVFSDPKIPKEYKFFYYKKGRDKQITDTGKFKPIPSSQRWEKFWFPATFQLVDSMQTYRKIRSASQNEKYSLDFQLNKHLGIRKLKFDFANHVSGIDWHRFMQKNYPIEYGIYNIFDCIGVELFDEKLKDLSLTLTTLLGYSELQTYESQPSMLLDKLHFFALENNHVLGTNPINRYEDVDEFVIDTKGWILTLSTHLTESNGLHCLKEFNHLKTFIRTYVADADLTSAYPSGQVFLNISRETTFREMVKIGSLNKEHQKQLGLNLTETRANALMVCNEIFKLPQLSKIDELYLKYKEKM